YLHLARNGGIFPRAKWLSFPFLFTLQISIDLIFVLLGIHISGGTVSVASVLLILYLGIMAVMLPRNLLYALTGVEVILYALQIEAYFRGWLNPLPAPVILDFQLSTAQLRVYEGLFIVTVTLNGLLVAHLSSRIHRSWMDAEDRGNFFDKLSNLIFLSLNDIETPKMYQTISEHLGKVFDADGVCLVRWDEDTQTEITLAACDTVEEADEKHSFPPNTVIASLRKSNRIITIEDVLHSEYFSSQIGNQFCARSLLAIPLHNLNDFTLWGTAMLYYHKPHKFTWEETRRGRYVADQITMLLSRAHLLEQTHRQAKLLADFSEHIAVLTSDLNHATLLPAIVESAQILTQSQSAALFLFDPAYHHVTCEHFKGLSRAFIDCAIAFFGARQNEEPFQIETFTHIPDVLADPTNHPLCEATLQEQRRALGFFRLGTPDGHTGVLVLCWTETHEITRTEIAIAQLFTDRAAASLHNADRFARAAHESLTDELTGLPNRRALNNRLEHEVSRSIRYQRTFAVVMLDLDGFKKVNDTRGHSIGDLLLQKVANALHKSIRKSDFSARYGGDEFVVVLPETDVSASHDAVEKIRQAIDLIGRNYPPLASIHISASIGVANFPMDGESADALLRVADQRLYKSKQLIS
ncbi:MAG: diguanylate cyclase, partial [Chloroflexota bacterium]